MWHGRVDARPSIRPTKACGHMRDDWYGAVAIPMSASCASSTAADAAPLSSVYFSEVAGSRSIVPWALGRVIELHARRTARLTHAQHHVPRCGRETPSVRLHSNTAHTHTNPAAAAAAGAYVLQTAPRIEAYSVLVFSILCISLLFSAVGTILSENLIFAVTHHGNTVKPTERRITKLIFAKHVVTNRLILPGGWYSIFASRRSASRGHHDLWSALVTLSRSDGISTRGKSFTVRQYRIFQSTVVGFVFRE